MISVHIDGANLYATCKNLGIEIDFKRLREYFGPELLRIYYYTAILPDGQRTTIQPLLDWLDYHGYTVVKKDAKEFIDPVTNRRKVKGNMDTEITVDCLDAAADCKRMWIFSGDGDFAYLVRRLKQMNVHVTVVSTIETEPRMCADELRRSADTFIDLKDLINTIGVADVKGKWT
jgi:uncharacterized LabA/DUF88 family protein